MTNKPILHNIRILDFTWVLAGPYATRLLADFGAEVIKVQWPAITAEQDAFARGYYNTWNRNKLGITLNLNRPAGVALAKKLVSISDAVVENFVPRVMENWGLDYANLKKIKPDIIMVSMSMMGQKSPAKNYVGYGPTVQAFSGLTARTSLPGGPPLGPGFSYADHIAGLYASAGLLGALEQRRKTGEGQHVDISEVAAMRGLLQDDESPQAAPYNVYRCRDGHWCALAVFTEEEWRGLKRALGSPAWAEEKRFAGAAARRENRAELDELIGSWAGEHAAKEVMSRLQQNGVAAGLVQDAADIAKDRQLKSRDFFVKGGVFTDASPVKMTDGGAECRKPAPVPGQDNNYVYGKLLGLSENEITDLKNKGVI
ncbi:MAG: CoA transferase [Dehalococcoidales bacterium]|jgi:crotonobetainyl-CoA:carnitine CoA-transferase CaiB-like acyl-CoA transferase